MNLRHRVQARFASSLFLISVLLLLSLFSTAQYRGDYIPGLVGMSAGTQPPPGFYLGNVTWIYPADTIKGNNGNTIPTGDLKITSAFNVISVNLVTNAKFLGGNFGVAAGIPFVKNRLQLDAFDVSSSLSFSDTIFTPANLGWHFKRADVQTSYSFVAPTGSFTSGATDNSGLGMWAHEIALSSTAYLDEKKSWSLAGSFNVEFHGKKSGTNITVGDLGTVEYGVGKSFFKKVGGPIPLITTVGAAGYSQFKITGDSGSDIPAALQGLKDHVSALGPEVSLFIPQPRLTLLFRYLPEFAAQNRTQGQAFVFAVVWVAKSLAKPPQP